MPQGKEEKTEITLINPKPTKTPSLWMNMLTLTLLFGLIVGAQQLSEKWLSKTPPPEAEENQIVLEDHESEQPLAESATVTMPTTQETEPVAEPKKTVSETPKVTAKPVATEKPRKVKKVVRMELTPPRTDPYTDGGPLDLDRPENRQGEIKVIRVPQGSDTMEATATPTLPLPERDQIMPFE